MTRVQLTAIILVTFFCATSSAADFCNGQPKQNFRGENVYPNGLAVGEYDSLHFNRNQLRVIWGNSRQFSLYHPDKTYLVSGDDILYPNGQKIVVGTTFFYPNGRALKYNDQCWTDDGSPMVTCPQRISVPFKGNGFNAKLVIAEGRVSSVVYTFKSDQIEISYSVNTFYGDVTDIFAICH